MPKPKPPAMRRKIPAPPPPKPPKVDPPADEPDPQPLKLAGTEPDPDAVDEQPAGFTPGNNAAAQTPAANAKRKQSLQVSHALRRMLAMTPQQFEQAATAPGTVADQIASQLVLSARQGTMDAIKTIYDRTEGRVPQALEVNNTAHKDVHERVSDIARDRANAAAIAATRGLPEGEEVLEVSEDRADRSEGDDGQPGVASETAG